MNNDQSLKMTELDSLTAAPHLQMIKAALPYIQTPEQQRFFSIFTKVSELERTIRLFSEKEEGTLGICSLNEDEPATPLDMLNAMKPYGTQSEQDFIDLIINFLQSSQIYRSYQESAGSVREDDIPGSFIKKQTVNTQSTVQNDVPNDDFGGFQHNFLNGFQNMNQNMNQNPNQNPSQNNAQNGAQNNTQNSTQNSTQKNNTNSSGPRSGAEEGGHRNDSRRFSFDQFRNILPPEQQSKLETAQLLMQTFQQFS